ncbi:MAG: LuxR C-terminal-related transcriptional regulator [Symbiobacteriaceae bacterium]|nr:LuxR C-terminal-related transcriptional regulator [Symbiobacteriaceae bacterium]
MSGALTAINLDNSPLTAYFMPRPRVDEIFDRATQCKLVYVIAGAGYGKTQAVHHYIQKHPEAVVRWLQLTESDNIGFRYWEHLSHIIASDNPDLAAKLREFGFPETLVRFKQFAEILRTTEHRSPKTFLVLDDFHLIHAKQALTFAERCAYLQIPGACVIIISRKEPDINVLPLLSKGHVSMVTEDELRFTEDELATFLRWRQIPFSANDLPKLYGATQGWALATKLLSLVLARMPKNIDHALEIMKQNIFKLLEIEAFNDLPESVQKTMVKLSLISDLPLTLLNKNSSDASYIEKAPQLASFMWYDSMIGDYRIHPLYVEFLQSKQDLLSDQEKQEAYRWAAQWCSENNFYMDTINYLAKLHQYDRMLDTMLSYPFKLPYDACEYLWHILATLNPDSQEKDTRSVLLLKDLFMPLLYIGMGKYDEARDLSLAIINEWENSDLPISSYLLYTAYSNLAYINTYTCMVTHNYDFPKHLKKAMAYYKSSSVPPVKVEGPFGVADIRAFSCLVGEGAVLAEFDLFLETARETALYIAETYHSMYYGYDDLVACELAFFKNQPETARNYAYSAIFKAREKRQYSIEAMAEHLLLRLAVQEGDYSLARELLKQFRDHLSNANFWNRQLLHDLYTGLFYIQIGLPKMAPSWLADEEKEALSDVRLPARELIVKAKYYIACKKYKNALTVLGNSYPREPQERFALGELTLTLLTAVAKLKTSDTPGAILDLQRAYELSYCGHFEMPFIELGRELHTLIVAALKQGNCHIPEDWLKAVDRKATIYTKKAAVISNIIKNENNLTETAQLSLREHTVLQDLYHGLSRDEIAANQYLSRNTVDKILQSVFIKLDAKNSADALRIAVETRLIE